MDILGPVLVQVVRDLELATNANIRLDRYDLDKCCPMNEFKAHRVRIDPVDIGKLFLPGDFAKYTIGGSSRVEDLLPQAMDDGGIARLLGDGADLSVPTHSPILMVANDIDGDKLFIYDGGHRMSAHFLKYRTSKPIHAYISIHAKIGEWKLFPRLSAH